MENLKSEIEIGKVFAGLMKRKTPEEVIETRTGRGGLQLDYVRTYWVVEQLNNLSEEYGIFWSFEVKEHEVMGEDGQVWVKGELSMKLPGVKYEEIKPDGTIIRFEREPIELKRSNFGGSDIKSYREGGGVIDIADDLKAAASDCLKKCASLFGVAMDVYSKGGENGTRRLLESQLDALYKAGEKKFGSREKVDEWCLSEFGVKPAGMDEKTFLSALKEIRRR